MTSGSFKSNESPDCDANRALAPLHLGNHADVCPVVTEAQPALAVLAPSFRRLFHSLTALAAVVSVRRSFAVVDLPHLREQQVDNARLQVYLQDVSKRKCLSSCGERTDSLPDALIAHFVAAFGDATKSIKLRAS
jgi:hypothetical protein